MTSDGSVFWVWSTSVVYSSGESYRHDFDKAFTGSLGLIVEAARDRFEIRLVEGEDSMFEPVSVAEALVGFVVRVLERDARRLSGTGR